ncbi:MAG: hypothetical protein ABJE47_21965 [bacterium]
MSYGAVDVRLGKQIISWGRADAVNPTDNLTPRDLTMLVAEDDDQRSGVPAGRLAVAVGGLTVTGLWLAAFQGSTLPFGTMLPGTRTNRPTQREAMRQGALRIERAGERVDWSVSYFSGFDLSPDLALRSTPAGDVLELTNNRLHVLGADAATTLGRFGVRAEAAVITTGDGSGSNPEIKNSTFFAVVGTDRTFGEYFNVNVQSIVRVVRGFTAPESEADPSRRAVALLLAGLSQQLRAVQHGATIRVSNKWLHETLDAEVSGIFLASPGQLLMRPRASYAFSDRWKLVAGTDRADGAAGTLFRSLRANSLAFAELRRGL